MAPLLKVAVPEATSRLPVPVSAGRSVSAASASVPVPESARLLFVTVVKGSSRVSVAPSARVKPPAEVKCSRLKEPVAFPAGRTILGVPPRTWMRPFLKMAPPALAISICALSCSSMMCVSTSIFWKESFASSRNEKSVICGDCTFQPFAALFLLSTTAPLPETVTVLLIDFELPLSRFIVKVASVAISSAGSVAETSVRENCAPFTQSLALEPVMAPTVNGAVESSFTVRVTWSPRAILPEAKGVPTRPAARSVETLAVRVSAERAAAGPTRVSGEAP